MLNLSHVITNLLSPLSSDYLLLCSLGVALVLMLLMLRLFGAAGLFVYGAVVVIFSNIEVLKVVKFSFYPEPMALGTVVFSTLFICSDILTENYGKAKAQKSVWLGFAAMILFTVLMQITLAYKPAAGVGYTKFYDTHHAMRVLFTPEISILCASLIAYVISQLNDIWIFSMMSKWTHGSMLWLRTAVSTSIGAFIDNTIFSVLAWVVFAKHPIDWYTLFFTYILGAYFIRIFVAFVGVPVLYLSKLFVK